VAAESRTWEEPLVSTGNACVLPCTLLTLLPSANKCPSPSLSDCGTFEDQPDSASVKTADKKLPQNIWGNVENRSNAVLFIKRRSRRAHDILGRTHTMHAIGNAFNSICFGSNQNGIFFALPPLTMLPISATLASFCAWARLPILACKARSGKTSNP
jgi:hypothetical protein